MSPRRRKYFPTAVGDKPYQCCHCSARFSHAPTLDQHQRRHQRKYSHFCSVCTKGFYTSGDRNRHSNVHNKHSPFSCELCDNKYSRKFSLKMHLMRDHFSSLKGEKSRVNNTDKTESTKPRQLLKCMYCDKMVKCLRAHELKHIRKKFYPCKICSSVFTEISTLRQHYKAHKNNNINFCHICKQHFGKREQLASHIRQPCIIKSQAFVAIKDCMTADLSYFLSLPDNDLNILKNVRQQLIYRNEISKNKLWNFHISLEKNSSPTKIHKTKSNFSYDHPITSKEHLIKSKDYNISNTETILDQFCLPRSTALSELINKTEEQSMTVKIEPSEEICFNSKIESHVGSACGGVSEEKYDQKLLMMCNSETSMSGLQQIECASAVEQDLPLGPLLLKKDPYFEAVEEPIDWDMASAHCSWCP